MATTGAKLPQSAVSADETPWTDNDWVDPTNIYGAGEASVSAATFDAGDQTWVLKAYNFDFSSIPDNAIIKGVTCVINARYANAPGSIDLLQLLDINRAKVGTNQCSTPVALTTSAADYTKGGASDLWGNVLTPAWVKDPDFGVAIGMLAGGSGNNNVDVFCDYVTLEITYGLAYAETVNDSLGITDARTLVRTVSHTIDNSLGITDAKIYGQSAVRTIADSVGLTDVAVKVLHKLSEGTNCGFVLVAPTAIPGAVEGEDADANIMAIKFVSPADAIKITELGWYMDITGDPADYDIGVYDHDAVNNRPGDIVGISRNNPHGTVAGWKRATGLNIPISGNTTYWLGLQGDETPSWPTDVDAENHTGWEFAYHYTATYTALPDPWPDGTGLHPTGRAIAIYALYSNGVDYTETINDALGVTDAQALVRNVSCTFNESMGVSDVPGRVGEALRVLVEELGLTDSVTDTKGQNRTIDDALGLVDTLAKDEVKILADSLGLTDETVWVFVVLRVLNESMGLADAMGYIATGPILRTINDALGLTDGGMIKNITATVAESFGLSDAHTKDNTKTLADSIGLTDDATRVCVLVKTLADSLDVSDDIAKVWVALRALADDLGITDIMTEQYVPGGDTFIETINDALGITDSSSKVHVALQTFSENLGLSDSVVRLFIVSRLISDNEGITDGVVLNRTLTITNSLGLTDSFTKLLTILRTQNDVVGLTDVLVRVLAINRIITDSESLTDNLVLSRMMVVADILGISDAVTKLINYIRTRDDSVGLLDAMIRVAAAIKTINDTMGITDAETHHLGLLIKIAWMMAGNVGALNSTINRN